MLDTTTGAAIDLAPVLNPLIQLAGAVLAATLPALGWLAINWVRGKLKLQKIEADAGTQAKIDDVAQKVIAGAMARANLQPGQLVITIHNQVIADAGAKIAASLGKEIASLGASDIAQRAREIVENRLGLMLAASHGTPVPGPTASPMPTAVAQQPTPVIPPVADVQARGR